MNKQLVKISDLITCIGIMVILLFDTTYACEMADYNCLEVDTKESLIILIIKYILELIGFIIIIFLTINSYKYFIIKKNNEQSKKALNNLLMIIVSLIVIVIFYFILINIQQNLIAANNNNLFL